MGSDKPVVVDFFATWCGPCRILTPVLEEVLAGVRDKVDLAKVDIDELTELAVEYQVTAVPTVVGVKNGQVQEKFCGVQEKENIKAFVNCLVNS